MNNYDIINQLKRIEDKFKIILPFEYKEILLGNKLTLGDFKPGKNLINLDDFFGTGAIDDYYSIFEEEKGYSLEFINGNCRKNHVMPKELFAIGGFESFIACIGVKGKYIGKIYFVDQNYMNPEADEEGAWFNNVYFVADNITEFLNGILLDNQFSFFDDNFISSGPKLIGFQTFIQKLGLGIFPKKYSELNVEFKKVLDHIKLNPEIELSESWLNIKKDLEITEFDEMKRFNDFFYSILKSEQKKELGVLLDSME